MSRQEEDDADVPAMVKRHKQLTRRRTALHRELERLRAVFEEDVGLSLRQSLIDATRYIPLLLEDPPVYPDRRALVLLLGGVLTVECELNDLTKRLQDAGVDVANGLRGGRQ
jgi:hypothetical protein